MSTGGTPSDQTVAVVITTYNDPDFLHEALASVARQQKVPDQILVVDDGSEVSPAPIVALFPEATLICKPNGGLASARNAGLKAASAKFITFLDADDRFRSNAITAGLDCFARSPDAAMVYGGHIRISADGSQLGDDKYRPASNDPYADLLAGNRIGMNATVLYRRDILLAEGGFDEGLRLCEDYDVYLRLARKYPVVSHPEIVAEYRWHGRNMSRNTALMLRATLAVHDRHREQTGAREQAWRAGRRAWKSWYKAVNKSLGWGAGGHGFASDWICANGIKASEEPASKWTAPQTVRAHPRNLASSPGLRSIRPAWDNQAGQPRLWVGSGNSD